MWHDVLIGAITRGVNKPTLLVLNLAFGALWLALAFSLYATATSERTRWAAPHFAVMLGLCSCLALLINWFVANSGLVDAEAQQQELADRQPNEHASDVEGMPDAETQEKLRQLPLQSNIDLALRGAGSFDTSGLAVQPLAGTDLLRDTLAEADKQKAM